MAEDQNNKSGGLSEGVASKVGAEAGKRLAQKAAIRVMGLATGGLSIAASEIGSRIVAFVNRRKGEIATVGAGLAAAPFALGATLLTAAGAGLAALGVALVATVIGLPLVVAFFLLIINNSAYMVPPAQSLTSISLFEDRIIENADCPLVNGTLLANNPMWGSYNGSVGHGTDTYWNSVGRSCSSYPIPQQTSCYGTASNSCGLLNTCPYYGYALDVGSLTPIVVVPRIGEETITWNSVQGFSTSGGASTSIFTDTSGRYTIVLSHMDRQIPAGQTMQSGTQIGRLGVITTGSPHLHIEFQVDGIWVKPENYFCR